MDTHRWNRLKEIFDEAHELPPQARDAFVERACGDEPELLEEVKSLLTESDSVHEILDGVAIEAAGVLDDLSKEGTRVGPYLLRRQLGVGGMGEVYLAERADGQFEQQVALKLVRGAAHSRRMITRFLGERQIMARLQHPNIARLLDGGLTEDGQPYFVLEYVDGTPIDRYADEHGLDVDQRLRLFDQVCRAVTYAHANLVAHRDLKPSNILVTEEGRVKLLDFGIAKAITEEQDSEPMTQTGARMMTPAYASPEQARGEPVNTSTDIYSLGVVLYELLTGLRPYEVDPNNPLEAARVICEKEPERPSTAVTRDGTGRSAGSTGDASTLDPDRLRRRLTGDLDVICLKALRKEQERRYVTADEMGEDIRRHLDDLPIQARAESSAYRFRKFVRRHRVGVGVAAAMIVLVTALVGFYTARLSQERDRAQREAEKAQRVSEFLQEVFAVADPSESRGESVTAREILDAGAARLESDLADQPEILAEMLHVVANVYGGLGLYHRFLELEEKALSIRVGLFGPDNVSAAISMNDLGNAYRRLADHATADSLYRSALAVRRRLGEEVSIDVAIVLNNLGLSLEEQGNYALAESLHTESLAIRHAVLEPGDVELAVSLHNLARVKDRRGKYAEADSMYAEALELLRAAYGEVHPHVATSLRNRADTRRKMGDLAAAEDMYRQVVAIADSLFEPGHTRSASYRSALGRLLVDKGQYEEAEGLLLEALGAQRQALGSEHPMTLAIEGRLSLLYMETGRYEAADSLRQRNLRLNLDRFGPKHPRIAADLYRLGEIRLREGRFEEAAAYHREALDLRLELFGESHPRLAESLFGLGESLLGLERCDEAENMLRRALKIQVEFLGEEHEDVEETRKLLASVIDHRS